MIIESVNRKSKIKFTEKKTKLFKLQDKQIPYLLISYLQFSQKFYFLRCSKMTIRNNFMLS